MPFMRMAFLPSNNFPPQAALPETAAHLFYNRRVSQINDDIPKYNGYWWSHLAMSLHTLKIWLFVESCGSVLL
jgi:hypothetical protein